MSSKDDKCFICHKTGLNNVNIFTTYNVQNTKDKEELYVDVIKNCYNIEISPDSGLTTLCHECSMKLKKAYNFRIKILQAIENLISAQAEVTNNKEYSEIEYLEDIPFDDDYDIDPVLDSENGQLSYTLDEIYDGKEINASDEPEFLLHVDNDTVVDKVIFNNSNDNVSDIQRNGLNIEKAGSDLDLEPKDTYIIDKSVEHYPIDIFSDMTVDDDLEPGQIRVIDKIDSCLIDGNHEVIVDKKKVIIKSLGKINTNDNNVMKAIVNHKAGPLDIVDKIPESKTHLVDEVIDEKNKASKDNVNTKRVTRQTKNKDEEVLSQATLVKLNDLIKSKRNIYKRVVKEKKDELNLLARMCKKKRNPVKDTKNKDKPNQALTTPEKNKRKGRKSVVKEKKDELSLLAQICTEHQKPDEDTKNKDKAVVNEAQTLVKLDGNDDIKDTQKVAEEKKDELSLLAQICTEHPNPNEYTKNKDKPKAETTPEKNKRKGRKSVVKEKKDELSLLAQICTEHQKPDEDTKNKDKAVVNEAQTLVKLDGNDDIKDTQKVAEEKKDELSLLAQICTEHPNPNEYTKNKDKPKAETTPEKNKRKGRKSVVKEKKDELSLLAQICTEHQKPDEDTKNKDKAVVNEAQTLVKLDENDDIKDTKATQKVMEEKKDELSLLAQICTEHPNPDEYTKNRDKPNQAETTPEKNKRKGRKSASKEKRDELSLLAQICTEHPNPDEYTITKNKTMVNEADTLVKLDGNDVIKDTNATQKVMEEKKDELSFLAQICSEHPNPEEDTNNKNETVLKQSDTLVNLNTSDLIMNKRNVSKKVVHDKKHELILLVPICTEQQNSDQAETGPEKDKRKRCKRVVKEKIDELSLLARICTEHPNPDENTKNKDKTEPKQAEIIPENDKKKRKRVVKEKIDKLSLLARICTEHPNPDEETKNKDKMVVNEPETLVKLDANDLIKDNTKSNKVVKENKDKSDVLEQICTEQNLDETMSNQADTLAKLNTNDLIKAEIQSKRIIKEKKDELVLAKIGTEHPIPYNTNKKDEVLNKSETSVNQNNPIKGKKKATKRVAKQKKGKIILLAPISTEQNTDKTLINKDKTVVNEAVTLVKLSPNDLIKVKKKVSKKVAKKKKDELDTVNVKEINEGKDEAANVDVDVDDKDGSKQSKSKKRKKVPSVKENLSASVKAKKPRKEKKEKSPLPCTLQPNQTSCAICPAKFETSHALSVHMNTHYPQFVCGECGLRYANRDRLRQHQRTHDQGPFLCKVCDKQFSNSNTRNAHTWRVHSKGDPFKCKHCDMRFPTYLQRLRHVQSAHGETPKYVCQFCDAKFAYAAYRTKHIRTMHLGERPHQCQHCPSAFARARNLAAHLASKHGEGQKSYRCPICGMSFYFRSSLRWHVSQHNHKYPCNQCDQKFATNAELESHIQIHEHADNMAINLDFVTSLHLDALADDYALIDPSYLDLNEL